jgi:hypothetical protein
MAANSSERLRGQVARSRWGERDQIGRLNLMSEASRQAVLSRLDPSRTFDLGVEYRIGMPSWTKWGDTPYQIWMTHTPSGTAVDDRNDQGEAMNRRIGYSGDAIAMYSHCGTHLDTLNHFGYGEEIFNGYRAAEHLGSRHWDICGAEQIPPIVARGVLLDVARHRGVDVLAPGEQLGAADLTAVAREADILVAAIGRPGFVTADYIKPGAVVVDVGVNRVVNRAEAVAMFGEGSARLATFDEKKTGIVGDVHPLGLGAASAFTPVPGGVGPLTIVMLLKNTLAAAVARR